MSFIEIIYRIITEAVIPGVGSILSFIPAIALMIFILSLLRRSGMIRGDLAPFLMGFSCSVPAVLSCSCSPAAARQYAGSRSGFDKNQHFLTPFLIPYISCSAKLPVYLLICSVFFPAYPAVVISSIYLVGIIMIILLNTLSKLPSGDLFMQRAACRQGSGDLQSSGLSFFKRLHRPSPRAVFDDVKDVCLGFVQKAFTIILIGSVIIWFLQNFDTSLSFTEDMDDSLLSQVGDFTAPLFKPLGFGDRRAVAALLSGLPGKEAAASTLAVLAGAPGGSALCMMLRDIFTPASAFSFMIFYLLYAPCMATLGAIKTVTGKWRYALLTLIGQTIIAWFVSLFTYNVALLIGPLFIT